MKRNLKQILLVFLALVFTVSASTCLFSCGKDDAKNTTDATIPGIEATGTTGGTVDAAGGTTGGVQNPAGTTTGTVTPPANEGGYTNPLTGLKTANSSVTTLKPLAVVVDNVDAALAHQTGLTQADIVYETLVTPGITRFTALVSDYSALKDICNIREAYMEHIGIVGSHNAILVSHGGASHLTDFATRAAACFGGGFKDGGDTYGYINTMKDVAFTSEGGTKYGTIKTNSDRTDISYDILLTKSAVAAIFSSKYSAFVKSGATEKGEGKGFAFVAPTETKVMNGAAANTVKIAFKTEGYTSTKNVSYVYNTASGKYLRYQGTSNAHKDSATNEQLAFTNVVTLFTDVTGQKLSGNAVVTSTNVEGEGTGYYFYGGQAVEIKWSKSAWNGALTLTDTSGNALKLACGTTYVAYVDNTNTAASVSFN